MTLANSANIPSPITLTIRPRCSFTFGSMTVPQSAFHCERVPSSSASTSRLYPAISAARMAVSRRSMRSLAKHPSYSLSTVIQGSLRLSGCGRPEHERDVGPQARTARRVDQNRAYRFAPASTLARSTTTEDARRLLRHVGTGLGDLAILNRGCAGDADGPDNLAIRDEQNAALQRRGSA